MIQVEDFLSKKTTKLTSKQEELLNEVLVGLSDHATLGAKGASVYEVSKAEIIQLLPTVLSQEVIKHFNNFERAEQLATSGLDAKGIRERALGEVYTVLYAKSVDPNAIGADEIDVNDFRSIIVPNLCSIAQDYQFVPAFCAEGQQGTDELKIVPPTTDIPSVTTNTEGLPTWLKVLLWIVGIIVVGFVGVIVVFAIKAKLRDAQDEEE